MRAPDFFIVGQPKAGTTALYAMLRQHPAIFMPALKEPMFLASDLRDRGSAPHKGAPLASREAYLSLFAAAAPDQRTGEASTLYLFSQTAAGAIAELNPKALIVAIFREPVSFLHSWFLQLREDRQETARSLVRALALEGERSRGRRVPRRAYRPQVLRYSEQIGYTDQLRRYHDRLGAEQVLTLIYDDYRADNTVTVSRVCDFLGVRSDLPLSGGEVNPTIWLRSLALDDVVHRVSVGRGRSARAVQLAVKAALPASLRQPALEVAKRRLRGAAPALEPELARDLRRRFKPEVERFSDYLGRDLVRLWHYDELD